MKMPSYDRKSTLPVDVVIADIKAAMSENSPIRIEKRKIIYHGELVKICTLRLQTFAIRGLICKCGLQASYFALERHHVSKNGVYHLNLWGVNEIGEEILFTHDHVLARSLGGKDEIENTTTMCTICNFEKSLIEANQQKPK